MNNNQTFLRIAGISEESVVDGPGIRFVIFTQGCPHRCKGCHNPNTHDFNGGYEVAIGDLAKKISQMKLIDGITFSGGEPFSQAKALAELTKLIKPLNLNIITYSGYYHADLLHLAQNDPGIAALLSQTDILIDGPYDETKKDLNLPFRGSSNQSIIFLSKPNL